jgi:hypothetical protein
VTSRIALHHPIVVSPSQGIVRILDAYGVDGLPTLKQRATQFALIFLTAYRKEASIMGTAILIRVVAGALAVVVLSVIVYRRKQKAV